MSRSTAVLSIAFLLTSAADAAVSIRPNLLKYRDSSVPHAVGRAGDAVIDAVALLGKDGMTDLAVAANGSIDKVQLKVDGENAVNYTNLDGARFAQRLAGLPGHMPLQVQANVSNVDGSRTDVVTAEEIVKYRPDLEVGDVRAPQRALPGLPFEVTATVRELNGDVGARTNCVLAANGVEIDRAAGIWVDAHGAVDCKFSAVLRAMGPQTLTVSATGVDPGDWDDANNSASAAITISEPFDDYFAAAFEGDSHQHIVFSTPFRHTESTTDRWQQWTSFNGTVAVDLDVDKLDASYSETSDGTPIDDFSYGGMTWYGGSDSDEWRCRIGYNDWTTDLALISFCVGHPFGPTFASVSASRSTNEVTYLAANYYPGGVYLTPGSYVEGKATPHYGTSVSLVVTLTDGTHTYQGAPTVALAPYSRQYGMPYNCETFGYEICRENWTTEVGRRGVVNASQSY